jgi:predicted ABC-type ATPase
MKLSETNDGKKGGLLKGKPHYDSNGKPIGGIKAIVTDSKKMVELEGGEVIINKEASKKYWKELSKINQSAGNGVPISNPNSNNDEDPEEYREGGKIIEFNPNHLPNRRILAYAKRIKSEYPKVWDMGGNIFGNEAFRNLQRVSERGYWLESEKWMYVKWRSFVARHTHDFRIRGVIAMLKWVDKVDKGWDYMKNLIELEIEKKYPSKMEKGGNVDSNIKFMKWFTTWYKTINKDINISFSLPNNLLPFKEENVIILELFEKINQKIDAKIYLKEIVKKADEYHVTIYLEPKPRYKYISNINKKNKITKNYLITYYGEFGFQLTPDKNFMKRLPNDKMDKGGNLKNDCINYITKSKSIFNNGYYFHIKNLNNYIDVGDEIISNIKSLVMITYNSGGQSNLKVIDTINASELSSEISKLLNCKISIARIIVSEQIKYAKRFSSNVLKIIENENIVIADRDKIVCTNISEKYAKGGQVITYRNKFNKKYGYALNDSHSLTEIAEITKISLSALQDIYDKGIGAYKTNPESVRPNVKSKEQWAMARVYSAVMGGKASVIDKNELKRGKMTKGGELAKGIKSEKEGFTCEIIKNGERQIDAKSIEKLTKCIETLPQTKTLNLENGEYTDERKELHKEIIKEAKKGVTCITKGKPIAVLMGGSPASGKTTFLKKYRPYLLLNNLFKVDADEVRAKLPEYKGWNASQTHKETGDIVKTLISDRNIGIPCLFDFIYDGTMTSVEKYESLIQFLKKEGYIIYIVFMGNIDKNVVKKRALERYKSSGRFVPMGVIDEFYETGEKTLNTLKKQVDGYIVVDASSDSYEIMEEGGKRLPNERIYEKLGETIKLAKGGKVSNKEKKGDCYVAGGHIVMDYKGGNIKKLKFFGEPYLVHAEVSGQGELDGVRFGHAFVEDDYFVYDFSNGKDLTIPKVIYYRIGNIKEKKPCYYKYSFDEAMKKMRETMTFGPWDLKTKSGL